MGWETAEAVTVTVGGRHREEETDTHRQVKRTGSLGKEYSEGEQRELGAEKIGSMSLGKGGVSFHALDCWQKLKYPTKYQDMESQ